MKTEDLFKFGVTPKEGPAKGHRFVVSNVTREGVSGTCENGKDTFFFKHGEYDIYVEPKTVFEDDSIPCTFGNLKEAVEKAGLDDDTKICAQFGFWPHSLQEACARIVKVEGKKAILIY